MMNLIDIFLTTWHAYPIWLSILIGALLALVGVEVHQLLKQREEKKEKDNRRSIYLEEAVEAIEYAERIQRAGITSVSLLDEFAKAYGEREANGPRKTWKRVIEGPCFVVTNCITTLKSLEYIREKIDAGEVTYGQLGTVDVSFADLLDYFRDNFPVI